jgi:hypothetical protein
VSVSGEAANRDALVLPHPQQVVDVVDPADGWQHLRPALETLLREAQSAGLVPDPLSAAPDAGPAEDALSRLLAGAGRANDELLVPIPLPGARLLCVRLDRSAAHSAMLAGVSSERGCFGMRYDALRAVILIRDTPRRPRDDRALADARRIARGIVDREPAARVGVSAALTGPADLRGAFADVSDATCLGSIDGPASGESCIHHVEQHWADILLLRLQRRLRDDAPAANPVVRLMAYDRRHGSDLCHTVTAWLRNERNVAVTAAEVCVHPNTLRYRLRRAGEISGVRFDDGRQRLAFELILTATGGP